MAMVTGTEHLFEAEWRQITAESEAPTRLRQAKVVEFGEFRDRVQSGDPNFVAELVDSIYSGDAYILRDALPADELKRLREGVFRYGLGRTRSEQPIADDCPNLNYRVATNARENGGYGFTSNVYNFFRWNGDEFGIFDMIAELYRISKFISGLSPDAYENNRPSDGTVDKVEILHYPSGVGGIDIHSDPVNNVRLVLGVNLTEPGVDYQQGGFVMVDADGDCRSIEELAPLGSVVAFFPSIYHGVLVIDPLEHEDWDSPKGRWFMGISSVDSHMVEGRDKTMPDHGFATVQEQKQAALVNAR